MRGIAKRLKAIEKVVKPQAESESITFVIKFIEPGGKVNSVLIIGADGNQELKDENYKTFRET